MSLTTTECEQLLGNGGGPLRGPPDEFDVFSGVRREVLPTEEKLGTSEHDRHLIVGLVRDATGQLTYRLDALGLAHVLRQEPPAR